jgi:hypothetical protein
MRKAIPILLALAALGLPGCVDNSTAPPHDVTPPAAPRGLYSVTGDGQVSLYWMANTEGDVAGYRVYEAPCATGNSCPYDRVGATSATQFVVGGLTDGVTRYYAVAAVDNAGNESALSVNDVFDTPRPAGSATITNFLSDSTHAGWDFSAFSVQPSYGATTADIFFGKTAASPRCSRWTSWVCRQRRSRTQALPRASMRWTSRRTAAGHPRAAWNSSRATATWCGPATTTTPSSGSLDSRAHK